jgi:PLP dependent protein
MSETLVTSIRDRYHRILNQIGEAAAGCGRDPATIHLIVVSKSQPLVNIRESVAAGANAFGENYIEEAVIKISALRETGVEWHMIGHVQSRKADLVAANFTMLHSLDSVKLARRLNRFCGEQNRILRVLLEFNVSGEESKFGFSAWEEDRWPNLIPEIEELMGCNHLRVCGLMTMPPFFTDAQRTRPYFQRLCHLQEFLIKEFPIVDWRELSMGTSMDFVTAIQEGATFVRIGQAIFGTRTE